MSLSLSPEIILVLGPCARAEVGGDVGLVRDDEAALRPRDPRVLVRHLDPSRIALPSRTACVSTSSIVKYMLMLLLPF